MTYKLLVLLTIVSCAFSCERFTFEEGFDKLFSADLGLCPPMPGTWTIGTFESLNMKGFHERSTQFIYPDQQISCVSSPLFDMVSGGIIEVNTFMATSEPGNIIQVIILDEFNADAGSGTEFGSDFPGAWGTIRITVIGYSPFRGRVSIIGVASKASLVLVDSFRYLPPGSSEMDCSLYEADDDDSEQITTNGTTIDTIDHTSDGTVVSTTNPTTDSTDIIPTETTIEDKSGEDISTSPNPISGDCKYGLIARLKIAISVAVNVSAEVVAPLMRIIN